MHGIIEFRGPDRPLANVLETRAFQRLRRIKQMGFAWQVYTGAEHTRFGHALGTFHIAGRVSAKLGLSEVQTRHVKLAALLHDIGHGPFSHAWETVFSVLITPGEQHMDVARGTPCAHPYERYRLAAA